MPRPLDGIRKEAISRALETNWIERRKQADAFQRAVLYELWNMPGIQDLARNISQDAWHWYRLPGSTRSNARWIDPYIQAPSAYHAMCSYYDRYKTSTIDYRRLQVWQNLKGPWRFALHLPTHRIEGGCYGAAVLVVCGSRVERRAVEDWPQLMPPDLQDPLFKPNRAAQKGAAANLL
jgi:hypothetical protein